ncbi:MAG: hypothetical protein AAFY43_09700, partial [Pseudomonadota bacterium]
NPQEYTDLRSTTDVLAPIADATDGAVMRAGANGQGAPDIRRVGRRGAASGSDWIGLRERDAYTVRASTSQPLLPGLLAALLIALLLILAWRREGQ